MRVVSTAELATLGEDVTDSRTLTQRFFHFLSFSDNLHQKNRYMPTKPPKVFEPTDERGCSVIGEGSTATGDEKTQLTCLHACQPRSWSQIILPVAAKLVSTNSANPL